jgi:hypothetical protein
MAAEGEELKGRFGESVSDKLAGWLIPHYMGAARAALTANQDRNERWTVLRTVCADLVALRRGDHYVERLRLQGERLEATRQLTQEKKELEFSEWLKRPDVQERVRPRATRERVLRRVHQIFDHVMLGNPLPDFEYMDDEEPEPQPDPAAMIRNPLPSQSHLIQVNPTQSNQIKPEEPHGRVLPHREAPARNVTCYL